MSNYNGYPLYTAKQSRQIDQRVIEQQSIPSYELMQRAASACFEQIQQHFAAAKSAIVFTGSGNNGGDGYLIAQQLLDAGCQVRVCEVLPMREGGDGERAKQDYLKAGGDICTLAVDFSDIDLIVDAILGTGLQRPLSEAVQEVIVTINQLSTTSETSSPVVLAVDIPSGLNADTGQALPVAVKATMTVTFIARKCGVFTAQGKDYCGAIVTADLGAEEDMFSDIVPQAYLMNARMPLFTPRKHNSHKGDYGHVLVIGGDNGMGGAVGLAAEAALRCGSGKVSIATRPQHIGTITARCPELMVHGITELSALDVMLEKADVIAIGPGLGQGEWSQMLLSKVLQHRHLMVIDADALVLLAHEAVADTRWILTPHPGEARHLLAGVSVYNRFDCAQSIVKKYGGVCVLKGAGTLVTDGDKTRVCAYGNPGMATAGMGDVLTGVIAAFIAQGATLINAACAAVNIHAQVGDEVARQGKRGMIASDLMPYFRKHIEENYEK